MYSLIRNIKIQDILSLKWRRWFAWRPIRLNNGNVVWCKWTYRRKTSMTLRWRADYSPGTFTPIIKFKDYEYIDTQEYLLEVIKNNESLLQDAEDLFRDLQLSKLDVCTRIK